MKHKHILMTSILVVIIGAILFFKERDSSNGYFSSRKLQFLSKYIDTNYLYDINEASGIEGIYKGYLEGLNNSGTYYLTKEELKRTQVEQQGNYFGTGLTLMWSIDEHYLIVVEVKENSPADKAGIKVGDCITKVGDIQAIASNRNDIIALIYESISTPLEYEVSRDNKIIVVELVPEEVILEDVEYKMIEDILYLKLNAIKNETSEKIQSILDKVSGSCKGIVLDLRDITTNNVKEIAQISDLFLDKEIAFKIETKSEGVTIYETIEGACDLDMVLLTNQNTTGGIEALVLALEERAQIFGGNTGGDIYIKKIITFEDGTGMSVASGKISNRYGVELSSEGIEPDTRLYINEEERLLDILEGKVDEAEDSYLQAAIESFLIEN